MSATEEEVARQWAHVRARDLEKLEPAIAEISKHPDVRVLRRHAPVTRYADPAGITELKHGIYVDTETTGLDLRHDKIIELGLAYFTFDLTGVVYDVGVAGYYEDPKVPIAAEITAITGITDEMVRGQAIDDLAVVPRIEAADLVIAHHAGFDRPMLERRLPAFAAKAWACSMLDVPWRTWGCRDLKLEHLLSFFRREFHEGHRATDDARVGLHLLQSNAAVLGDGSSFLRVLLGNARQPTVRVWAVSAPFDSKDTHLKPRGYRWNPADGPYSVKKCWYRDVRREDLFEEIAWLQDQVYLGIDPPLVLEEFTAKRRYSTRPGKMVRDGLAELLAGPPDDASGPKAAEGMGRLSDG